MLSSPDDRSWSTYSSVLPRVTEAQSTSKPTLSAIASSTLVSGIGPRDKPSNSSRGSADPWSGLDSEAFNSFHRCVTLKLTVGQLDSIAATSGTIINSSWHLRSDLLTVLSFSMLSAVRKLNARPAFRFCFLPVRPRIRGTDHERPTFGRCLASMIIPCWNQLEFTRKCIAALLRRTRPPWELIVVNNGSTDGTADYLAGVQDVSPVPVTIIANGTNRGFPAAINQGLQYARGEYLVLLNNDVVVTDGWLEQLVALATVGCTTEMADWNSGARDLEVAGTDQRVFTTEGTENTEVRAGNGGDGVSAGSAGMRGWGCGLVSGRGNSRLGSLGLCRIMRRRRSWSRMCLTGIWKR